jgi:hypothetical protein
VSKLGEEGQFYCVLKSHYEFLVHENRICKQMVGNVNMQSLVSLKVVKKLNIMAYSYGLETLQE